MSGVRDYDSARKQLRSFFLVASFGLDRKRKNVDSRKRSSHKSLLLRARAALIREFGCDGGRFDVRKKRADAVVHCRAMASAGRRNGARPRPVFGVETQEKLVILSLVVVVASLRRTRGRVPLDLDGSGSMLHVRNRPTSHPRGRETGRPGRRAGLSRRTAAPGAAAQP